MVDIHAARTLVRRSGTRKVVGEQGAVWAGPLRRQVHTGGRAHHVIFTQAVWEKFKANDYNALSCDCNDAPTRPRGVLGRNRKASPGFGVRFPAQ